MSKKIGLALGAGGARGLAHIGVIKELERAGIKIDFIAGASMGAVVGGFYAATKDIAFLEESFLKLKTREIFGKTQFSKRGADKEGIFFRRQPILDALEHRVKDIKIEDCRIPFVAVAADAKNGDEVRIEKGRLLEAIKASAAIPMIFKPVAIHNKVLIDGVFVNPVPADIVREMGAEYVIAVDVLSNWFNISETPLDIKGIYSVITNSFGFLSHQIAKGPLSKADLILKPAVLSFNWFDFREAENIIGAGAKETRDNLSEIIEKGGYPPLAKTAFEKLLDYLFGD